MGLGGQTFPHPSSGTSTRRGSKYLATIHDDFGASSVAATLSAEQNVQRDERRQSVSAPRFQNSFPKDNELMTDNCRTFVLLLSASAVLSQEQHEEHNDDGVDPLAVDPLLGWQKQVQKVEGGRKGLGGLPEGKVWVGLHCGGEFQGRVEEGKREGDCRVTCLASGIRLLQASYYQV